MGLLLLVISFLLLMVTSKYQSLAFNPSGFHLELIHRDSPKSPLYSGNVTFTERIRQHLECSKHRASRLLSKQTNPDLMKPYVMYDDFTYLVRINVGTPYKLVYLILDTGTDLTWLQCQPCKTCFKQEYQIFDPRNSSTYQKLPCGHTMCQFFQCINGECAYLTRYGYGDYTKGVASFETFTVTTVGEPHTSLNNFLFGCSHESVGFMRKNAIVAGIMGLNRAPVSMITQYSTFIENRFSYCFTDPRLKEMPINYLRFGSDIGFIGGDVKTTPLAYNPDRMYGLNLLDISVQNTRLNYPPGTFKLNPTTGKGGFIVDTGSALTMLNVYAYLKLKGAVDEYVSRDHSLRRIDCPIPIVDLCFMLNDFNSFPTITFHFEKADLKLEIENVFIIDKQENFFALAMAPVQEEINILGAWQQFNTRFIFSLASETMSFVRTDCSNDIG